MKSSKMKMTAILLTVVFLLAGCGDALYELTPEEETAIVSYASQLVAKYNTYQREGEVNVSPEMLEPEEPETEALPPEEQAQTPQEQPDTPEQNTPDAVPDQPSLEGESFSTINEALDLGVVQVEYTGSSCEWNRECSCTDDDTAE